MSGSGRAERRGGGPDDPGAPPTEEAPDQPKGPARILREEVEQGVQELERPGGGLFLSGLSAGLDIGFSLFFIATLLALFPDAPEGMRRVLIAAAYPIGFVFVILGRSELFTEHTTLAVFPVLTGDATVGQLARLWGIVFGANLLGAWGFAVVAVLIGPALGAFDRELLGEIASHAVDHTSTIILASALLAGWLMGLLSWLVASAKDTVSRILFVFLVTGGIGLAGLHHCIVGSVEVMAGVASGAGPGVAEYGRFLVWATLGNAIGGVLFVALIKYGHAVQERA